MLLNFLFLFAICCQRIAADPAPKTYTVNGVVKELPADGKSVVVRHEAIPGYMEAMVMPFEVHDTNLLRGLKPGDSVSFQLAVTPTNGWIESLTNLNSKPPPNFSAATTNTNGSVMRISKALPPLDVGDALPDYHFTNELGQPITLGQYQGQVVAFTFFFTSCPYPEFCPKMTMQFSEVQRALEKMTNAPAKWHLFSISFDPKRDTPDHLASYGAVVDYDRDRWSFLTGAEDQVSGLAEQMGENYWTEDNSIGHNLRTVVVAPNGRIRNIIPGSKWTVDELVKDIIEASK